MPKHSMDQDVVCHVQEQKGVGRCVLSARPVIEKGLLSRPPGMGGTLVLPCTLRLTGSAEHLRAAVRLAV